MDEMPIEATKPLLFGYKLSEKQRQELGERFRKGEFGHLSFEGYLPREITPAPKEYVSFVKWDRPHKGPIMAEASAAMEKWFASGVKFRRDPILTLPPDVMQHAMPPLLKGLLETAFGRITINVLRWEGVREDLIGQVLMATPALPPGVLAPFGVNWELDADFGLRVQDLPWGPVFWTRHLPPKQRAQVVGSRWYYLQASRIYTFISEQWARIQAEERGWATWQTEKFLDLQQTLRALNFDLADRVQYYECKLREFKAAEVSEILSKLGKRRSPEAVKKSYQRQSKLVQLRQKNL